MEARLPPQVADWNCPVHTRNAHFARTSYLHDACPTVSSHHWSSGPTPPDTLSNLWIPSPPAASALDLISRHQRLVTTQTLHPLSAYCNTTTGMSDLGDTSIPLLPGGCLETSRRRPELYFSSSHGSVYYTPRNPLDRRARAADPPSFPTPLIQPRQRRPHSIHIISYPAGFIPHDLREKPQPPAKKIKDKNKKGEKTHRGLPGGSKRERSEKRWSIRSLPPATDGAKGGVLEKLLSPFVRPSSSSAAGSIPPTPRPKSKASSLVSFARRLSRVEPLPEPAGAPSLSAMVDTLRPALVSSTNDGHNRNSMMSARSGKSVVASSIMEVAHQKPVACGSGVQCSIWLAESNVFLTGFDHDGRPRHESHNSTALLRGKLLLSVTKNVKIKSINLKLIGKARTEWPEGIPPLKVDMHEEETLRTQSIVFFHAMNDGLSETEYGNQCRFRLQSSSPKLVGPLTPNQSHSSMLHTGQKARQPNTLTAKELKRLSLQSVNSRSFGRGESALANPVHAKGYKVFYPGSYEYSFELPIDHHQLESTKLQYGSVKWELETTVERAGAFKPNLHGSKEVSIVRVPDQMSLEMTEPISISRQWEDQLHYDIIISGKSFPIGAKIPIAFKLTPLAKVQVHKLKVFVTESIEYWTNDRRVTRKDPGRKILLLEKTAGKPLDKKYETSELRVLAGGELSAAAREMARRSAVRRRAAEASRTNTVPEPLPDATENILGDLDLGLEHLIGSTEMEMNVQIPTCEMMKRDKTLRLHPDCSWKNVNVYHWIKIVMRVSRSDPEDPTGKRRRHFEISIDSPFTVLNCRATQANTSLPQYCGQHLPPAIRGEHNSCGCPDAISPDPSPSSSTGQLALIEQESFGLGSRRAGVDRVNSSALPTPPQAVHLQSPSTHTHGSTDNPALTMSASEQPYGNREAWPPAPWAPAANGPHAFGDNRPIHLLRHPSFNPPAFDADDPPPPLPSDVMTPPPNYDIIIGTPSVDGLADYFARRAIYESPDDATPTSGLGIRDSAVVIPSTDTVGRNSVDFFATAGDVNTMSGAVMVDQDRAEDSDSDENDDPARIHRRGRVSVANPRTPGGRLVPSRSFEIERPVVRLDMTGVVRRDGRN